MTRFTRRAVLKAGVAAGALAGGATGLLPRIAAAQADNRPSITVAVQQIVNANTLEPLREQSNVGTRIMTSIFESLIEQDLQKDLESIPGLATEWKRLDDRTVELKLRQGAKFHNGDEVTADDVVFSFGPERMFGKAGAPEQKLFTSVVPGDTKDLPPEVPAVAKRLWPALERIEAVDKYTVRFVNKVPDVTLEGRIARGGSQIISRRAFNEAKSWLEWARAPVGTGPYKVTEFRPDTSLTLTAFDDYWGDRPPVKQIRLVVVPEAASRINGLLSGQYDFACDIPPDQIVEIERNPRYEVAGGLITNHRIICFDKAHPELKDPRVRLAMCHAIDRQLIVEALWAGRTRVPKGLQWEFYGDMFHGDWSVPAYNPDLAKKLLREAGYKGGVIPYRVLNNYYAGQNSTAQVLSEMWRAVGINVEIQMKENWSQIFDRNSPRGVRDWSNSAPFNDPVSSIVNQHGPKGQQQQIGEWTNDEMNKLSVELETSTDRPKRKQMFRRMLEICEREDPAYTVLHQTAVFTAKRKDIAWKPAPSFAMDFRARNFKLTRG
ncbi:peptide/nickel transport system substrate-binding protein [Stella humosa]|uniref:Peptide/nickel transport system substrate-binding protein n=1 Tax=Stella humosa TaxID=94 RepID=A0A3N1L528_9PROT|nr:ABC transporter substrate-binding protein [Stella humosa]ROP84485.1 peptide/nickel transport system substrate-binding protein [Stella humosa]BBK34005.1 ABC transporter substrate-binding protein [Stella humosa]